MRRLTETLSGQAVLVNELLQIILEPILAEAGIGVPTFDLLNAIHGEKSGASQAQIAATLRVTPPTLCEAVKVGVRQGLILQEANLRDRRAKRLELTAKGKRILARALAKMNEAESRMVAGIAEEELDQAVSTLTRAVRNLALFARQ